MTITYRDGVSGDAAALATLGAWTFIDTFGHLYSPANLAAFLENHTVENWTAILASNASVRLAENDGRAVGYARLDQLLLPVPETGRRGLQLYQLYIAPPWHGRGVAQMLLAWVIDTARARGAQDLWLSVYVDNPRARAFYRRRGFEEVMPYTFMVGDHADEDIICRLALDA